MYADIIVNISAEAVDKDYQYRIPPEMEDEVRVGSRVDLMFGARKLSGYVIGLSTTPKLSEDRIRPILGLSKKAVAMDSRLIELAAWMKRTYGCTMNQALKTVLPAPRAVRKGKTRVEQVPEYTKETPQPAPDLNPEQQEAVLTVERERLGQKRPTLIFGVTGSGKTEVYMELIRRTIRRGQQAILLIPEISLTYQNLRRFYQRFGARVGVVNSRQSAGEKYENLEKARKGELDLMIGPRSALFTSFPRLGLIILDEEHEGAYHSDTMPRYHAADVARKLAEMWDASLVLGSATPSLESFYRCETGEYALARIRNRAVAGAALPNVHIVDLREELAAGNKSVFSRLLTEKIRERLERREQVMLFLNRRGYAGFVSCRSCGRVLKCPHCDVSLTFHRGGSLHCHYCGYKTAMPEHCPGCGSPYIAAFGTGTQKVETIVQKSFPEARVLRMDADTTGTKDGHSRILEAFRTDEADILVGTQMIVKGHDFPNVTLVGALAADLSLNAGDYRAAERTFELLTQACGRAGRGGKAGEVVIQTYSPEHYALTCSADQDYERFYKEEMTFRRLMNYPPASGLLVISVSGSEEKETLRQAEQLKLQLTEAFGKRGICVIGPAAGTIARLQDLYRQNLLIKHEDRELLLQVRNRGQELFPDSTSFDIF